MTDRTLLHLAARLCRAFVLTAATTALLIAPVLLLLAIVA